DPLGDAHDVSAAVADLASAKVEQPAELSMRVFRIVGNVAGRTEPRVVVELRWRRRIGCPVARGTGVVPAVDFADRADMSVPDVRAGMIGGGLRASLRANLYDAAVTLGGLRHSAAFLDRQAGRLFDVDVLARFARHDRHQGMPMVGSRD